MKSINFFKHYGLLLAAIVFTATLNGQTATKSISNSVKIATKQLCYTPSFVNDATDKPVKNIILMIGDGMGLAHISSGLFANHGELTLTNLHTIGFVRTQPAKTLTTDSAASGTAYATGKKTTNGRLGIDPDGNILNNLTEKSSALGYATGFITTDNLDGATPAAFYAHQASRSSETEILGDLPASKLTFFAGGSTQHVDSKRPSLYKELSESGFTIVADCRDKATNKAKRVGVIPDEKQTASVNENRGDFLPRTTEFALDYLSKMSDKGFFIMVEGARIDKSSHSNDFPAVVGEVLDFDLAVEKAIRFAEKEGNTLVIISADHETGRLGLSSNGDIAKGSVGGHFNSNGHTPIMVPLFAYGPCSNLFMGVQENSDVSNKIYELLKTQNK